MKKVESEEEFEHVLTPLVIENSESGIKFHSLGKTGAVVLILDKSIPEDENTAFLLGVGDCQRVSEWFVGIVELIGD